MEPGKAPFIPKAVASKQPLMLMAVLLAWLLLMWRNFYSEPISPGLSEQPNVDGCGHRLIARIVRM
jgi:hypothetical protein